MGQSATELALTREQLYERVWMTPMQKLAPEFGLSDVGLAKICKKFNIPRPPRGYWAKIEHGQKPKRCPLRPISGDSSPLIHFRPVLKQMNETKETESQVNTARDPEIAALIDAELLPDNRIEAATDLRGADLLVVATRESLEKKPPDEYGRVTRRYDFAQPCFEVAVAKENVHRALLLLQSLVGALKSRGFTFKTSNERCKSPRVSVLGQEFSISIWEPSKRQKRELTKAEKEELKRWSWRSIRDYDYVPTGSLELHLDRDTYWSKAKLSDTKRQRLEDRLNEFIIVMLEAVENQRTRDEKARREAAEKEQRRLKAIELEVEHRAESVRIERLRKVVPRFENALRIREYIAAVRAEAVRRQAAIDESSEIGRWLKWAEAYLDTVNPLSDRLELPTLSLTAPELDELRRECASDWQCWSESFRPRQPR